MSRETMTASQTIGPFFYDALIRPDSHVVASAGTAGQSIRLTGTVTDGEGQPIEDAMIEIWQPDGNGAFAARSDAGAFRGFGRSATDTAGVYRFETVKPGAVDVASAPFISVAVFARGLLQRLATRIYFDDEPANAGDAVFQGITDDTRRRTLLAVRTSGGDVPVYRFDIALQGPCETVFFDA